MNANAVPIRFMTPAILSEEALAPRTGHRRPPIPPTGARMIGPSVGKIEAAAWSVVILKEATTVNQTTSSDRSRVARAPCALCHRRTGAAGDGRRAGPGGQRTCQGVGGSTLASHRRPARLRRPDPRRQRFRRVDQLGARRPRLVRADTSPSRVSSRFRRSDPRRSSRHGSPPSLRRSRHR